MQKFKKGISIILATLMIMSVATISAGAQTYDSYALTKIFGQNKAAVSPSYTETFDTEEDALAFGSLSAETNFAESFDNGMLKLEDNASEDVLYESTAFANTDSLCYFEFDVKVDSTMGMPEYRLRSGSTNQVRLHIDSSTGEVSARNSSDRFIGDKTAKVNDINNIKILLDYTAQTYYVWVNNELCRWEDGNDGIGFVRATGVSTNSFVVRFPADAGEDVYTGNFYIDNFKVTPLVENDYKSVAATYLCNENFNSYPVGTGTVATVNNADATTVTANAGYENLVGANKIINLSCSGYGASTGNQLKICKEADGNLVLKHSSDALDTIHNLYLNASAAKEYLLVQTNFKAETENKTANLVMNLGTGVRVSKQKFQVNLTKSEVKVNGSNSTTTTNYIDGQWHTITYLLCKSGGTNGTATLWIDDTLVCKEVECYQTIKNEWPTALFIRDTDKAALDIYIDDLIAFEPDSSFFNVEKMDAALTGVADFSDIGADSAPTDFSAAILKNKAEVTAETATVTFKDSKGYFNGTNIILPLYEDTTDVLVEIADGNVKTMKEFTNVPIKPAYSISAKTPAVNPTATANFNAGAITATVRNASSDYSGRLNVFAAIYDSEGGKLLKVEKQADTLGNDEKFECKLDLSGLADTDLTNAVIKLFIFENGTLVPLN